MRNREGMTCEPTARETKSVNPAVRVGVCPRSAERARHRPRAARVTSLESPAQLFKDRGRYYLHRPDRCNDPYLENPTVSFKQGR